MKITICISFTLHAKHVFDRAITTNWNAQKTFQRLELRLPLLFTMQKNQSPISLEAKKLVANIAEAKQRYGIGQNFLNFQFYSDFTGVTGIFLHRHRIRLLILHLRLVPTPALKFCPTYPQPQGMTFFRYESSTQKKLFIPQDSPSFTLSYKVIKWGGVLTRNFHALFSRFPENFEKVLRPKFLCYGKDTYCYTLITIPDCKNYVQPISKTKNESDHWIRHKILQKVTGFLF